MKRILILLLLSTSFSLSYGQYDKNKLTTILTNGTTKAWSVKGVNTNPPEKSMTFNINMSAQLQKDDGKGGTVSQSEKWSISTKDNIRWFITLGSQQYELVISYLKNGSQYIKLTHPAGADKYEISLFPLK